MASTLTVPASATGDVTGAVQSTWTAAQSQIKTVVNNVVFPVMAILFFVKVGTSYFDCAPVKAEYLEEWHYHKTYSGTPQGGIISPILANIYLDKLDCFMEKLKKEFDLGKQRKSTSQANYFTRIMAKMRAQLKMAESAEEIKRLQKEIHRVELERQKYPYTDPFDPNFRRLQYTRYADDFLVGVIGNKEDALRIKAQIKEFISSVLKLELSEEKTLITNSEKRARFLGYDISVRRSLATKRDKTGRLRRYLYGTVCLELPTEIMRKKLLDYNAMTIEKTVYGKDDWKAKARSYLISNDPLEILDQYNSEIRGFRNYYRIANNSAFAGSFGYIMQYSMFKTFAGKYRLSMRKAIQKLRIGKNFGVHYTTKKGNVTTRMFYHDGFAREKTPGDSTVDLIPNTVRFSSKTSLMDRLSARQCELCGRTDVDIEIHHVRKLKDLGDKAHWERLMIARNRKTLALCKDCHTLLHAGKLS